MTSEFIVLIQANSLGNDSLSLSQIAMMLDGLDVWVSLGLKV